MLVHNPSRTLLPRQESALSFHIDYFNQNESEVKRFFSNIPVMIGVYSAVQLLDLLLSWYAVHQIMPNASILQAVLCITTIRSILLILFLVLYIKIVDRSLYFIDEDCKKLILIFAVLQFVGSLSHYFAFATFPVSQASTFSQLVSAIMLLLSYAFIKSKNDVIMIIAILQLLATLVFSSTVLNILIATISPLSSSLMGILQQVTAKQINKFTIIFYTCLLNAPVLLFLSIITGSLAYLFDIKLLFLIIIISLCQLLSFKFMNTLIDSQLQESTIWIISALIIFATIPFQIWLFASPIAFLPFFAQLIILGCSILITNK